MAHPRGIYLHVFLTRYSPAGVPNQVDKLIFSLGLGSGGYNHATITEPVSPALTSPSSSTRRRRQSQELRCPANGRNGEICQNPTQGLSMYFFLK